MSTRQTLLKKQLLLLIIVSVLALSFTHSADAQAWQNFLEAKKNGFPNEWGEISSGQYADDVVPDFSYAGYERGEKGIPDVSKSPYNWPVYDVTDYGAIPGDGNDDVSDIQKAVNAAQNNGKGIIYFPPGRYEVGESSSNSPANMINITKSRIVFRGAGYDSQGNHKTTLYMKNYIAPAYYQNGKFRAIGGDRLGSIITTITADARRGSFWIKVASSSGLEVDQWIDLHLPDSGLKWFDYADPVPYNTGRDDWGKFDDGVEIKEKHQIAEISGNNVRLKEPLLTWIDVSDRTWEVRLYQNLQMIGFEDIYFEGNWDSIDEPFDHHKNDIHDYGWVCFNFLNICNSWVRRCHFKDWNQTVAILNSSYFSYIQNEQSGKRAHYDTRFIHGGTGVFIGKCKVTSDGGKGAWHGPSVAYSQSGTVVWRTEYGSVTSPDCHGESPYATLYDNCVGGMNMSYIGGSDPRHLRHFVFWNQKSIDSSSFNIDYNTYKVFIRPLIIGFHGTPLTFNLSSLGYAESMGTKVNNPESLYESQLKNRLGYLPAWVYELKSENP